MDFKKIIPHLAAIALFICMTFLFFGPIYQGNVLQQSDLMTAKGKENEVKDFKEKTGETSLWTNQIFSGMPTYYGGVRYPGNLLRHVENYVLMLGLPQVPGHFILSLICAYLALLLLGFNPWLSVVGALAIGISTYNFLILEAGHLMKIRAIAYFPLIIAGVLLAYRKKYLLGASVFALSFALEIYTGHFQMTYYLGMALLIYVFIRLITAIREGELPSFVKASGVLLIGMILALGANTSKLTTSYNYMKQTIRGPAILEVNDATKKNNSKGLDKDYVFQWSQGIQESLTFLVPGFNGGGSQEKINEGSAFYQDLKKKGARKSDLKSAPLYWGGLPSTSGPIYFGAIMCLLFIFGLFVVKGEMKWWLLIASLMVLMLSWGKNFMWFSDIFYYYFPMYSKFRAVSSILVVLQVTIPFMAIWALSAIKQRKSEEQSFLLRSLYISAGIAGGLCLLIGLIGPNVLDFAGANDARYQQAGYNVSAIVSDRKSLLQKDAFRSLIFILLASAAMWLYIKDKLKFKQKELVFFAVMACLVLGDLGGIGKRYVHADKFISQRKYDANFKQRPVDKEISKDADPNFRVHDLTINAFNSNATTYHHKTIGGYHAVKLRRYNDMINYHIQKEDQLLRQGLSSAKSASDVQSIMSRLPVFNMLNTKYIVANPDSAPLQNPARLGNAWMVNNIKTVNSANEEINALNSFDPKSTAVVHSEFKDYLGSFNGGSGQGTIKLTDYKPNRLTYETKSGQEELAVLSEVWYSPNKEEGWQAFIDGNPVDHMRANYLLRAIKVPAGEHKVVFEFKPQAYYTGEKISMVFSLLILLGAIGIWGFLIKQNGRLNIEQEIA